MKHLFKKEMEKLTVSNLSSDPNVVCGPEKAI